MVNLCTKPNYFFLFPIEIGESARITISIRSNPKPTFGQWYMVDTTIPVGVGKFDKNRKFSSTDFQETNGNNQYQVHLHFIMASELSGKSVNFEVENKIGRTVLMLNNNLNSIIPFPPELEIISTYQFGMKKEESSCVQIKFKADPKPSEGQKRIG